MENRKYNIIVVDPPWKLKKITHRARPNQTNMDYSMMSMQDIANMPIGNLADDDCWCFLWTPQKYLFDSKKVLEEWGFNYLLTMVWEKTYGRSAGMPLFGFRWNAEFILVGYKSKPDMWPKRSLIPVVFSAENIRHSQKPDRFYEMVQNLGEKQVDLFARKRREGWDAWGDEVDSDPIFEDIEWKVD